MQITGGTPASERLYYAAKKWARRFSYLPYIRGYILTGSVNKKTASYESDIDIVAVSKDGRAWLVHAQLFVLLTILGMRRTKKSRAGKICVNATFSENVIEPDLNKDGEYLWQGTSRLIILEKICDAIRVSELCETIAHKTVDAYVQRKFLAHKKTKSAVLNNTQKHVQYFPPRNQSMDSLTAKKAHG